MTIAWGPIGKDIYESKYSRAKPDGTKETWEETVERVVEGNTKLVPKKFIERKEQEKLKDLLLNLKMLPAGRHLWVSGVPGRQFLFNCHNSHWTDDITNHYAFTFSELMKGGGVGANYSEKYVKKYGVVKHAVDLHIVCDPEHPNFEEFSTNLSSDFSHEWDGCIRIEDSREGWIKGLSKLLTKHYTENGKPLVLDMSLIRPRGSIIKGFGGIASGPQPLVQMLDNINKYLNTQVGKVLSGVQHMLLDHFIAECVISGNVRRSARISIKSWKDDDIFDFINCKKKDASLHWTTNISIEIDNNFVRALRKKDKHATKIYNACIEGALTNGEPGFWNKSLSEVGEPTEIVSPNPCAEIALSAWENCNLGHVNLQAFFDDKQGAKEAFRLMARFLIRATFADITDPKQAEIVRQNRRIGVGFFGYQGWVCKQGIGYTESANTESIKELLRAFKEVVKKEAREYSFQLRIPEPVKTTCIAPTGTISLLPGVSSGAQSIYSRFFIRRARFSSDEPVLQKYKDQGYKTEKDLYSDNTEIVEFICKDTLVQEVEDLGLDANIIEQQNEINLEESLAVQAMLQKEFVDNAISFTVSLEPDQYTVKEAGEVVKHYLPHIKGTTIMIDGSRPQSPFERITEEEYEKSEIKNVGQVEQECQNGACPIK